ncbi:ergothioneine biosynthesis protein EgtB [Frateuria terrea]|uniref:Ergothioneine biosynthesis protein EgtB n=1 Tax=Frateuria terrea TaxID=529704 RepID=A0A1H6WF45_9GAMM|nr:ergothioneine biosynthesis protein EgtB [Frateuria terrea]SEJ10945.1 ergothioneine biosynthesis protein EgtB [Frateuria terrea]SFP67615.1 ergothioneine biosynthesis protein EgtB [Frateuria terrea]
MAQLSTFAGQTLAERYRCIRQQSVRLCADLTAEDMMVQSMPDASPAKWHLAHTTWFFEQFVLGHDPHYRPREPAWHYLFNSYYQSVGPMHARPQRGLLSRPSLEEVLAWRRHVDEVVCERLLREDGGAPTALVELGLQHEQQHQELLLTDIQHALWSNPLLPAYLRAAPQVTASVSMPLQFLPGREGVLEIGHAGDGFAFDNETPRHRTWLAPHALANRLVTNEEYAAFVHDGGYHEPSLWLSDAWATVQREGWERPLYWQPDLSSAFSLAGVRALDPAAPVCHVSYYEADAFARWAGARLPTEAEWEVAAAALPVEGNLLDGTPRPAQAATGQGLAQMYGDAWEWTASPYIAYPGFRPLPGSLGEYNGKFMCGQWVLRGGSCATPRNHVRASYRNFFSPQARWQFAGLRLARDR